MDWQLAEAKNKFSEVVRRALTEGPQRITRRGDTVVVMSEAEFLAFSGKRPTFKEMLMSGPDLKRLDIDRDRSSLRDVDLP
jgi:prevent-host-death family protein